MMTPDGTTSPVGNRTSQEEKKETCTEQVEIVLLFFKKVCEVILGQNFASVYGCVSILMSPKGRNRKRNSKKYCTFQKINGDIPMTIKNPSASLISKANVAIFPDFSQEILVLEEWRDLLSSKLSIVTRVVMVHEKNSKEELALNTLMLVELGLNPYDVDRLCLLVTFEKGGIAGICSCFLSDEAAETEEFFKEFLRFKGTWEEVALKLVELNNFVASINTIPPIPDSLRE